MARRPALKPGTGTIEVGQLADIIAWIQVRGALSRPCTS
jgi:imidazolonepropionase-like amidohydrolase